MPKDKNMTISIIIVFIVVAIAIYFGFRHNSNVAQAPTTEPVAENTNTPKVKEESVSPTVQQGGLKIETITAGTGAEVKSGNTVSVKYTGMLANGTVFDSNVDPKFHHTEPFSFNVGAGQVIKGWDQGLVGMKVGEKRKLTIPAELAYGAGSPSPLIPPNSELIFEVELLSIQ